MDLCVQTLSSFDRLGEEKSIRLFKEIGFDCMDYSMFQPIAGEFMNHDDTMFAYYRDLRSMVDDIGMPIHQMHAPFISSATLRGKLEGCDELVPYIIKSIKVAGILGAKHIVVHGKEPVEGLCKCTQAEAFKMLIDYYKQLIPVAQENDVIIAVENLFGRNLQTNARISSFLTTAENMNSVINALNDIAGERRFAACLDLGHAGLFNNCAADMVHQLGDNLACLHVQDNDFLSDRHIMPYLGKTDIEGACRALRETNYQGDFTFECEFTVEPFPLPLLPDILRLLERVGRHLIDIIEGRQP